MASAFLPFLPMLPLHLLIRTCCMMCHRWRSRLITSTTRNSKAAALESGGSGALYDLLRPISSIFDILTFCLMWWVFHPTRRKRKRCSSRDGLWWAYCANADCAYDPHPPCAVYSELSSWPLMIMTVIVMIVGIALPFHRWPVICSCRRCR